MVELVSSCVIDLSVLLLIRFLYCLLGFFSPTFLQTRSAFSKKYFGSLKIGLFEKGKVQTKIKNNNLFTRMSFNTCI